MICRSLGAEETADTVTQPAWRRWKQ
jgi:hypothetical protein